MPFAAGFELLPASCQEGSPGFAGNGLFEIPKRELPAGVVASEPFADDSGSGVVLPLAGRRCDSSKVLRDFSSCCSSFNELD